MGCRSVTSSVNILLCYTPQKFILFRMVKVIEVLSSCFFCLHFFYHSCISGRMFLFLFFPISLNFPLSKMERKR